MADAMIAADTRVLLPLKDIQESSTPLSLNLIWHQCTELLSIDECKNGKETLILFHRRIFQLIKLHFVSLYFYKKSKSPASTFSFWHFCVCNCLGSDLSFQPMSTLVNLHCFLKDLYFVCSCCLLSLWKPVLASSASIHCWSQTLPFLSTNFLPYKNNCCETEDCY